MDMPATGISLEAVTTTANLDVILCNGTDRTTLVNLSATGMPDDWTAKFRPRVGSFLITSIELEPEQREDMQLRIRGPRDQSAADFTLTLQATSSTGAVLEERMLRVQRVEGDPEDPGEITVTASYPFLSGPASTVFEFELAVVNNTPEDVSLNLGALFPQGWGVVFLPAFGAETADHQRKHRHPVEPAHQGAGHAACAGRRRRLPNSRAHVRRGGRLR